MIAEDSCNRGFTPQLRRCGARTCRPAVTGPPQSTRFYEGIDLDARTLFLIILDTDGNDRSPCESALTILTYITEVHRQPIPVTGSPEADQFCRSNNPICTERIEHAYFLLVVEAAAAPVGQANPPATGEAEYRSAGKSSSSGQRDGQLPGDPGLGLAGQAVSIAVLANETDPDGDTLTVASATQGQHGSVEVNTNGTVTYTPAAGFTGADSFAYTISDGRGGTATASVAVTAPRPPRPGARRFGGRAPAHGTPDVRPIVEYRSDTFRP